LTLGTHQASVMTANVHQQNAEANSHGKEERERKKPTMICYTNPIHGLYQLVQDGGQIIYFCAHACSLWLAKRITLKDA